MELIYQAQDSMVLVVLSMTKLLSLEIKRQVSQLLSQIYKNKYNDTQERLVKSFGILRLRVSKKR
jgi:CRISPR/Cas system type I-B associated protein Csh2 (Cas7 group RAMP superfamily)